MGEGSTLDRFSRLIERNIPEMLLASCGHGFVKHGDQWKCIGNSFTAEPVKRGRASLMALSFY